MSAPSLVKKYIRKNDTVVVRLAAHGTNPSKKLMRNGLNPAMLKSLMKGSSGAMTRIDETHGMGEER